MSAQPPVVGPDSLRVEEVKAQHEYARHIFVVFVSWFTVFCTLNIAVLGWIATSSFKDADRPVKSVGALLCILLLTQNIMGIAASRAVMRALHKIRDRLDELVGAASNAMPHEFYAVAARLVLQACAASAITWAILPLVVPWKA